MTQQAFAVPETVESVVRCRNNGPLIAAAAQLWIKDTDLVVDATYGRGRFWTYYQPAMLIKHDLEVGDGIDFRALPEADQSVDVLVLDPPYIAQGGRDTSTIPDFMDRYGLRSCPTNRAELELMIADGIREAHRVLHPGGRLMVKCMDYISGGRYVTGHHHVVSTALRVGFKQVDEFVHHSGLGPQPPGRRQIHSRRAHSFLCVFEREKASIPQPHQHV